MKVHVYAGFVVVAALVSGCDVGGDSRNVTDRGIDAGPLIDGIANIWVDPDGCQHWYIDDGWEGYMTPRLNRDGTPRCTGNTGGTIVSKDGTVVPVS